MMEAQELKNSLPQFTGTSEWFRHPLMRSILYTEGVKFLADNAECHWLLDKIATLQMLDKIKVEEFQVWKMVVANDAGKLTCEDGNGHEVYAEAIEFTDFPLPEIQLWFTDNVILLPSEY